MKKKERPTNEKRALQEMGRRERRRVETREKIYRAAMKLFSERGFFETTTEAITEAADVGQGTFFNYFPTKQHILTVLAERQMDRVATARQAAESGTASIHTVLRGLIHALAEEPGHSVQLARTVLTAFVTSDEVRAFIGDAMARGRLNLRAIVLLGQKRGEINPKRKAADLAMAFQRSALGTVLLWAIQPKGSLNSWLDEAFKDFWAGAAN